MMKFVLAAVLSAAAVLGHPSVPGELPITTSDVFVQMGELSDSSVIVMVRCNQETNSAVALHMGDAMMDLGEVTYDTDFTVSYKMEGLTKSTMYEVVASCTSSVGAVEVMSETASFTTLPGADDEADISFVWVADLAGQGWGRNPEFEITNAMDGRTVKGGYVVFDTMEHLKPHFALFQGDMIYADNSIPATKDIPAEVGGGTWYNNPSKDFVAVSLDEFRHNWKYNFGDDKMQSFLLKTPVFVSWDDHEVTNNWYPSEILVDTNGQYPPNTVVDELYMNSLQAFYEHNPLLPDSLIFRKQKFGKHLEIFFVDYRSYRDPNPGNSDPNGIAMMGPEQLEWLKNGLMDSTATWKIISSHDPFGIVTGGEGDRDAFGQMDPAILGREFEVKELLETIAANDITGVVSLTSDVHFTAHVNHDPSRAEGGFTDFLPLDEFVIGPINSGAFGPGGQDTSFGPEYVFVKAPGTEGLGGNLPPSETSLQSFGHASVSASGDLTIKLMSITGELMYEKKMAAASLTTGAATGGAAGGETDEKCRRLR